MCHTNGIDEMSQNCCSPHGNDEGINACIMQSMYMYSTFHLVNLQHSSVVSGTA